MFTFIMTIYLIALVYMTIAVIVNLSARTTVGRMSNLVNLPSDIAHASTLIVALLWGLFFLLTYLI